MDAVELIGLAAWSFVVAVAGGAVGLVLGNLRLPLFVLAASSPAAAGGANIAVSGIAAATASTSHIRAGRINWRLFGWMAPPSVVGALLGGYFAGRVPRSALLLAIAAVLLYSGLDLLLRTPKPARAREGPHVLSAVLSGLVIGLLGGFVGLILGSLQMPALLRIVGETPSRAVGTNLAVGVCDGVAGLLGHLPSAAPDWRADRGRRRGVDSGSAARRAPDRAALRARARPGDRRCPARRRHGSRDSGLRLTRRDSPQRILPLRLRTPNPRRLYCLQTGSMGGSKAMTRKLIVLTLALALGLAVTGVAGARWFNVIRGTRNADVLVGTDHRDLILAFAGNDQITAGGGRDIVYAGKDNDTVDGGPGFDRIFGGAGDDTLIAGNGPSVVWAGPGNDTIVGGTGRNVLHGGSGDDTVTGGPRRDHLWVGPGTDVENGGDGNDVLHALARDGQVDTLDCGPGDRDVAVLRAGEPDTTVNCEIVRTR